MILREVEAASMQFDAWAADRAAPRVRAARPAGSGLALRLQGVGKSFGERQVLKGIDLQIEPGEFVAIVGRSGCGKSTLLRLLAGLESAEAGTLLLDGSAPAVEREDVRMMFQDARLLPWKRVADNIGLGLQCADAPARARSRASVRGASRPSAMLSCTDFQGSSRASWNMMRMSA